MLIAFKAILIAAVPEETAKAYLLFIFLKNFFERPYMKIFSDIFKSMSHKYRALIKKLVDSFFSSLSIISYPGIYNFSKIFLYDIFTGFKENAELISDIYFLKFLSFFRLLSKFSNLYSFKNILMTFSIKISISLLLFFWILLF